MSLCTSDNEIFILLQCQMKGGDETGFKDKNASIKSKNCEH